jgi:hypothetical protein
MNEPRGAALTKRELFLSMQSRCFSSPRPYHFRELISFNASMSSA